MSFRNFVITVALLMCNATAHAISGQPGTLDAFWNTGGALPGKAITTIGGGNDVAVAAVLQPDGKVVLAGNCVNTPGSGNMFCLTRYKTDGTLDTTFNGTGKVTTVLPNGNSKLNAMALQGDGKIVVAGINCQIAFSARFCAVRYNADGSLDLSFNGTGIAIAQIQATLADENANAVAVQRDGKIVLAGYCNAQFATNFCAVRFNPNGSLDTSFTIVTKVHLFDFASSIVLQTDGKIVIAGSCTDSSMYVFCAARYNANGTLDLSFNGTGIVLTYIGPNGSLAHAAAMQPDGKLVMVGECIQSSSSLFCASRYTVGGLPDTTFNATGNVLVATSGGNYGKAVAIQPDGKILISGICTTPTPSDILCVVRLNSDGSLDKSFKGGVASVQAGGSGEVANAVLIQPDGKIVLAGTCNNGSNLDFCALRVEGGPFGYQNCKPDVDGDGAFLATTDALIYTRIALGITGSAVINGITFPATATRNTWPLIRDYLTAQCGLSLP